MSRLALLVISCLLFQNSFSQFYFQDIVTAGISSKNFQELKKNGVRKVAVTSIEPDGSETEDFGITQTVNAAANTLTTVTSSGITGSSILITTFNAANLPTKIVDSTASTVNTVEYQYDNSGKLISLKSYSHQPDDTNHYTIREDHFFEYDAKGHLQRMLKVKDNYDTLAVVFVASDNGMPGEERWYKRNRKTETWYYYYDEGKRLTDVVRFNEIAKKMLPDYIFEYDTLGNMSQQTVVQPGTNFYRLWIYDYNEKGLKKSETIFKKGKEQEGRIIYSYE